jgi:bisanhydrobacterioruberin hydratase
VGLIAWIGWRRALIALSVLSIAAISFEALSITTGVPYGTFEYSSAIGYPLFGLVPWTVPFAWIPLVIASSARWKGVISGALFLVLIDLLLDPLAVKLGFWTWDYPGRYYDIPFSNFVGWFITGIIGVSVIKMATRGVTTQPGPWVFVSLRYILMFWIIAAITAGFILPAVLGAYAWYLLEKKKLRPHKI